MARRLALCILLMAALVLNSDAETEASVLAPETETTASQPSADKRQPALTEEAVATKTTERPAAATKKAEKPATTKTPEVPFAEKEASSDPGTAPSGDVTTQAKEDTEADTEDSMFSWPMVLVAVVVIAAGYLLAARGHWRTKRGCTLLIAGPSNAGKTTLFLTLKDGRVHNGTTTSMQENQSTFAVQGFEEDAGEENPTTPFVDFPGDPSLSYRLLEFLPTAKAIVFVVDSNDKKSVEREAAESMYQILTHPEVVEQAPPIFVACNKTESLLANKPPVLKRLMQEELNKLRTTQGRAELSVTDEADVKETIPLGMEGEPFEFDKHSPCEVEFLKCSCVKPHDKDKGLGPLVQRIRAAMSA